MIILENVTKKFGTGVIGINDISFSVEKGEFTFLTGPTGSGKTTIFRMLIREMIPSHGSIIINNWNIVKLPGNKVPELRKRVGVVFQDLKLLPDRTVFENVSLPLELSGIKQKDAKKRVDEILEMVGISDHTSKFPIQLSGGERQRAAIARSLILSPEILLADEPTGDLDDETAWGIVELLKNINEGGTTIIMATHNSDIIKKMNKRVLELNKGTLINDKNGHKKHVEPKAESAKAEVSEKPNSKEEKNVSDDFEEALKEK